MIAGHLASTLLLPAAFVTIVGGNLTGIFANPQPLLPGYAVIPDEDVRIAPYKTTPPGTVSCAPGSVAYDNVNNVLVVCSSTGLSSTTMVGPLVKPTQ